VVVYRIVFIVVVLAFYALISSARLRGICMLHLRAQVNPGYPPILTRLEAT
jgi:hypothetical protein